MVEVHQLLHEAQSLLEQNRFSEVEDKLEPLLLKIPKTDLNTTTIKLCLGQAKAGLGKLDQAETLFRELVELHESQRWPPEVTIVVKHELFLVLTKQNKSKEADSLLKEILELPDSRDLVKSKATLLDIVGRKDEALEYLRKALSVNKYDAMARVLMTHILRSKEDVTTKFLCPHCRTEYDIPVFYEDPSAPIQKAAYVRERKMFVDSVTIVTCRNCGKIATLYLWLCRNCYADFAGEAIVSIDNTQYGKRVWTKVPFHCPSCLDRNIYNTNDPQEDRFLTEMVKLLGMKGDLQAFDSITSGFEKDTTPKSANEWYELARKYIEEGKTDEADKAFCEAIGLAPHRVDIVDAYLKFSEEKGR